MPNLCRAAHDLESFEVDRVCRHVSLGGMVAVPLLAVAAISGCAGGTVADPSERRSRSVDPPAREAPPAPFTATPEPGPEEESARSATAPRPPGTRSLFPSRRAAPSPSQVMEGVRRAARGRSEAIFACYDSAPCGPYGAEPSRVVVSLTVAVTGEVSVLGTLRVTHYRWAGEEREEVQGDVAGALARCVERALQGLESAVVPERAVELHYPVTPEAASCEAR